MISREKSRRVIAEGTKYFQGADLLFGIVFKKFIVISHALHKIIQARKTSWVPRTENTGRTNPSCSHSHSPAECLENCTELPDSNVCQSIYPAPLLPLTLGPWHFVQLLSQLWYAHKKFTPVSQMFTCFTDSGLKGRKFLLNYESITCFLKGIPTMTFAVFTGCKSKTAQRIERGKKKGVRGNKRESKELLGWKYLSLTLWKRIFSDLAAQYDENEINAKCLILNSEWAKFPLTFKICSPANGIQEQLPAPKAHPAPCSVSPLCVECMYRISEISTASCEWCMKWMSWALYKGEILKACCNHCSTISYGLHRKDA